VLFRHPFFNDIDRDAALALFVGSIQRLLMQSLLINDPDQMRIEAPRMFAFIRHGLTTAQLHQQEKISES